MRSPFASSAFIRSFKTSQTSSKLFGNQQFRAQTTCRTRNMSTGMLFFPLCILWTVSNLLQPNKILALRIPTSGPLVGSVLMTNRGHMLALFWTWAPCHSSWKYAKLSQFSSYLLADLPWRNSKLGPMRAHSKTRLQRRSDVNSLNLNG